MTNIRQRTTGIENLVDPENPQRDGKVLPDEQGLTRMQNTVRYMRGNPMYLPPNEWPEGIVLHGLSKEGRLVCSFFMLLKQFEDISKEKLFSLCHPDTERLFFIPTVKMPENDEDAKRQLDGWLQQPHEVIERQLMYLYVNRWYVNKHDDQ